MLQGCEAWDNVTWHAISVFARDLFSIADLYDRSTFIWLWPCICSSSFPLQITLGTVADLGAGLCRVITWQRAFSWWLSPFDKNLKTLDMRRWRNTMLAGFFWANWCEAVSLLTCIFFFLFLEGFTENIYIFKAFLILLFSSEFLNCPCFPQEPIYRQRLSYWEDSAGRAWGGFLEVTSPARQISLLLAWRGGRNPSLQTRWERLQNQENTCKGGTSYLLLASWRNRVSKLPLQAWSWIFKLSTYSFFLPEGSFVFLFKWNLKAFFEVSRGENRF